LGFTIDVSMGAWLFIEPDIILLEGVLKPLGGEPASMSHSEAMGVAVRTLVRRGIWVLIRRFSMSCALPGLMVIPRGFYSLTIYIANENYHII